MHNVSRSRLATLYSSTVVFGVLHSVLFAVPCRLVANTFYMPCSRQWFLCTTPHLIGVFHFIDTSKTGQGFLSYWNLEADLYFDPGPTVSGLVSVR